MPWVQIGQQAGGIASVPGEPTPPPEPPSNILYSTFSYIASGFRSVSDFFYELSEYLSSATFIGDWLAGPFILVGDIFGEMATTLESWAIAAGDLDLQIANIITWEGIRDAIETNLFEGKSLFTFISDVLTDFFDEQIKPTLDGLWDKATDIATYIDTQIENLEIPDWASLSDGASEWLRDQLYKLLPWGDAPDLSMLEEASAWLGNSIDGIPWLSDIKSWYDNVVSDARDILDDPQGWLSKNLEGAFSSMLKLAGWPLLRAVEAFVNRMWDEKE